MYTIQRLLFYPIFQFLLVPQEYFSAFLKLVSELIFCFVIPHFPLPPPEKKMLIP